MGLDFALDELYSTGWSALDSSGCAHHTDGRAYPAPERARREFMAAGYALSSRKIDGYGCYQAEWTGSDGSAAGAVVGQSEAEAVVYALAQLRRQRVLTHA